MMKTLVMVPKAILLSSIILRPGSISLLKGGRMLLTSMRPIHLWIENLTREDL